MNRPLRAPLALTTALATALATGLVSVTAVVPATAFAANPTGAGARTLLQVPPDMSDEEKIAQAKDLYVAAEKLAAEENWVAAVPLYEQAYYLVPSKHGFAHKVGIAAYKTDDCDKAYQYLTHFVTYAEGDKYADKRAEATTILGEIEARECRTQQAEPEPEPETEPVSEENPFENPNEPDEPKPGDKKKGGNGLLIGGVALLVVGVGGVGLGGAGFGISSSRINELESLASTNGSPTGYPVGDYACRDSGDPCPPTLEGQAQTWNTIGYVGMGVGGALVIVGATLIGLHAAKKKKAGGKAASRANGPQLTGLGPVLVPGGTGAAAEIRF